MTQRFREVTVLQPTWFMHRRVFNKVGGYNADTNSPEDMIFFYRHLELGGSLLKVDDVLLKYRYHENMTSHKISRQTLMRYKAKAFENSVIKYWDTFMIWSCGRDGKLFYKMLSEQNQAKVKGFVDINEKKIGTILVINHVTKQKIPVYHWSECTSPFVAWFFLIYIYM
eukprot:TRINITY_DN4692_c0_g1_i2.p1 TRINITY_DN4692_c0_g1~~TRINITY_DN4692_c0_g1_i2.p1  ORF type:complete len:169 (-),score=22.35 TRINITY_DN4692_c0_g1_i2:27-533(-)